MQPYVTMECQMGGLAELRSLHNLCISMVKNI